jgi:type I restriction enzyme, S subunit
MKNNWQTKELGEVLEYEQPTPYIVSSKNYKEEYETPVLTAGKSFILGKTKEKSGIFPKDKLPVIIFDDFTTATQFVDFPFKVKSSAMKILHPVKMISNAKFIFYLIQTINFNYKGIHKRYWISEYSKIKILLPPLLEQRRIVKILDEAFKKIEKARENAEKNIKNAKELFKSYLNSIFVDPENNWEQKTLGELSDVITKGTTPTTLGFKFINKGINFVKIESITTDGEFIPSKFAAITLDCHESLKRSQLKDGDILYSIAGALGRTAFVTKNILPANTNQAIAIVRLKTNLNVYPEFVLRCLHPSLMLAQISKYKGGVAQQNLSLEQLKGFVINLPPIKDQNRIVKEIDTVFIKTKKLEAIYKRKLADLEELKRSILKKAFNGEL